MFVSHIFMYILGRREYFRGQIVKYRPSYKSRNLKEVHNILIFYNMGYFSSIFIKIEALYKLKEKLVCCRNTFTKTNCRTSESV